MTELICQTISLKEKKKKKTPTTNQQTTASLFLEYLRSVNVFQCININKAWKTGSVVEVRINTALGPEEDLLIH